MSEDQKYERILSIPATTDAGLLGAKMLEEADLVLHGGTIIKDRYGDVPREATPAELVRFRNGTTEFVGSDGEKIARIVEYIANQEGGGVFSISFKSGRGWMTAAEFGQEAEDSPMAGGASYGSGDTLTECLDTMLRETRA